MTFKSHVYIFGGLASCVKLADEVVSYVGVHIGLIISGCITICMDLKFLAIFFFLIKQKE